MLGFWPPGILAAVMGSSLIIATFVYPIEHHSKVSWQELTPKDTPPHTCNILKSVKTTCARRCGGRVPRPYYDIVQQMCSSAGMNRLFTGKFNLLLHVRCICIQLALNAS